jgi:hypothetical protein
MILRNVSRARAIALGLIEPEEILEPDPDPNFNQGLAATMQGLSPDIAQALKAMLPPGLGALKVSQVAP